MVAYYLEQVKNTFWKQINNQYELIKFSDSTLQSSTIDVESKHLAKSKLLQNIPGIYLHF